MAATHSNAFSYATSGGYFRVTIESSIPNEWLVVSEVLRECAELKALLIAGGRDVDAIMARVVEHVTESRNLN